MATTEMKRKITGDMIKIYRLCHHDFGALSYVEAAKIENVSVRTVYRILNNMRQIAPQLFPILTGDQATIWRAWDAEDNLTIEELAISLGLTEDALNSKLAVIRHKLGVSRPQKKDTVRMPSSQMDELRPDDIAETF